MAIHGLALAASGGPGGRPRARLGGLLAGLLFGPLTALGAPPVSLAYGAAADAGMSADVLRAATSLYSEAVARGDLTGVVLLVARHGKVVLHEAIGMRDVERQLPMRMDTPFQIKSMTKPVIASAALVLADRGKLSLSDPVSRFLPAFSAGRSADITVLNAANHTSGYRISSAFVSAARDIPEGATLQQEVARYPTVGPAEAPGTTYEYSNPGYNTLAAVVEVASQQTIERFLEEALFRPLGMTHTHAHWRGQPTDDLPTPYRKENGSWAPFSEDEPPFAVGYGGLVSTAWDYATFCQMYLNRGVYRGTRVLSEDAVRQATTITVRSANLYPSNAQLEQRGMKPRWYYRRDGRGLGIDVGYGLGWTISADGTFAHAGAWETFAWVDPQRDLIGIILTQDLGGRNPGIEFVNVVNAAVIDDRRRR